MPMARVATVGYGEGCVPPRCPVPQLSEGRDLHFMEGWERGAIPLLLCSSQASCWLGLPLPWRVV